MRKSLFQLAFALLVIGFGVLLLLHNLNLVDLELDVVWGYVYPSLFILLNLKNVINSYLKSKRGYRNFGWFWGLSLALFGGLLLSQNHDVVQDLGAVKEQYIVGLREIDVFFKELW